MNRISEMSQRTKELIFITIAVVFLLVGIVGIVIPLLPTTPFLLLSAYFLKRGSKKFHHWLVHHWLLGPPICDWEQRQVIRRSAKIFATTIMAISSIFVLSMDKIPLVGKGTYLLVLVAVLTFIWTRNEK